jgi:selenocysteine-specific elongation factor
VRTSARTRAGLDDLLHALEKLTAALPARPTDRFFRLPVDRAFAMQGVGLVVTGTAWSGKVSEGESLELLPAQKQARVRGLQVHGHKRTEAFAGERVAINLHGLKREDVERGMLLATPGMMQPSWMIDARLSLLPSFDRPLKNRTRVRVHHGAAEVLARVVLLDRDALEPGESAPVQLRLEEPLCTERGDRIVLRFYSPMYTLGGVEVVDPRPVKHKRFRDDVLQGLALKETGGPADVIADALRRAGTSGATQQDLTARRIVDAEHLDAVLESLLEQAQAIAVGQRLYDAQALSLARQTTVALAQNHQEVNPLSWGIPRAELQERLQWKGSRADFGDLLDHLASQPLEPQIHLRPDAVRVGSTGRELSAADAALLDAMEAALQDGRFAPPSAAELQKQLQVRERFAAYVGVLEEQGRLVRLNEALLYHPSALAEIETRLRTFLATHDSMKMGDFKDLTDISRKYAVPLLEWFDRHGITRREGDVRKPGPQLRGEDT